MKKLKTSLLIIIGVILNISCSESRIISSNSTDLKDDGRFLFGLVDDIFSDDAQNCSCNCGSKPSNNGNYTENEGNDNEGNVTNDDSISQKLCKDEGAWKLIGRCIWDECIKSKDDLQKCRDQLIADGCRKEENASKMENCLTEIRAEIQRIDNNKTTKKPSMQRSDKEIVNGKFLFGLDDMFEFLFSDEDEGDCLSGTTINFPPPPTKKPAAASSLAPSAPQQPTTSNGNSNGATTSPNKTEDENKIEKKPESF